MSVKRERAQNRIRKNGTPQVPVRTVLPSEYARADLATTKV